MKVPGYLLELLNGSDVIAAIVEVTVPGQFMVTAIDAWLFRESSPFQEVVIAHSPTLGRVLFLDGVIQLSEMDEQLYHEHLVLPSLLLHPEPRRVLILGGGDGLALREVLRDARVTQAVLVDLDALVIQARTTYLADMQRSSMSDPRATILADDARNYLRAPDGRFDVVVIDLIDAYTQQDLDLYEELIASLEHVLAPGGLVVVQGAGVNAPDYHALHVKTMVERYFPHVALYHTYVASYLADYGFILASHQDVLQSTSPELLNQRAAQFTLPPQTFAAESLPGMMRETPYLKAMQQHILTTPLPESYAASTWIFDDQA